MTHFDSLRFPLGTRKLGFRVTARGLQRLVDSLSLLTLVRSEEMFKISALQVMNKCNLFKNTPALLLSPDMVQFPVRLATFQELISAFEEKIITITDISFTEIHRLCESFGFSEIAAKLSEFLFSMTLKEADIGAEAEDTDPRGRIAAFEEKANQYDHDTAILRRRSTSSLSSPQTLRFLSGKFSAL
jgi:hypothetical protein